MREVVDDNVGVDTVLLDQPFAFGAVDTVHGGAPNTTVAETVSGIEPDLPTPGAHTDDLAKTQAPQSFRERFAVGVRVRVHEHHHVAAEGILHVPVWLPGAVLPVHPILA